MKTSLIAFCIGALVASSSLKWLILLTPFIFVYLCFKHQRYFVAAACFMLGMAWVLGHMYEAEQKALKPTSKVTSVLLGRIENLINSDEKITFDFVTAKGRIKTSCYHCSLSIHSGDEWELSLRLKPFITLHNPNYFDYRLWMLSKGYIASASVLLKESNVLIQKNEGWGLNENVSSVLSKQHTPILRALLLGDKQALKANDRRLINQSGISHLFVVSGLHISLVAILTIAFFLWLQRPLLILHWRYSFILASSLGVTMACTYAWLSGFNVPAIRALLMLLFAMMMLWGRRNIPALDYWLWALIILLLLAPLTFFDMGSWLSFGIVLALILGMSGITAVEPDSNGRFLSNGKRGVVTVLRAQWLAFCIGGMILTSFQFSVAPLSLLLNLLLIPLMAFVLVPMAFIGLLIALLGFSSVLFFCEGLLTGLFSLLREFEVYLTYSIPSHDGNRALLIMVFVLWMLPRALGVQMLSVVLFMMVVLVDIERPKQGGFRMMVLDVGQGSAAVIETLHHNVVIDTGYASKNRLGMADYVVMPYLNSRNIKRVDLLHLTHDDADHAGGYDALKSMVGTTVRQSHCDRQSWFWDGVLFERFQAPGFYKGNNGTCLLKISAEGGGQVLFSGDIEVKAEKSLIKHYPRLLKADVLMIPHHGSKSSSSLALIDAVSPYLGVVSAGALNHYGHPHKQVMKRYKERLVKIYSTASHGAVEVMFSPRQEARIVSTYRPND